MNRSYAVLSVTLASAAAAFVSRFAVQAFGCPLRENLGISFGLLASNTTVAAIVSFIGLLLMLFAALSGILPAAGSMWTAVAAGGAASNMLERIFFGAVSDWLVLPFSDAIFEGGLAVNLADMEICAGAAIAFLYILQSGNDDSRCI